MNDLNLLKNFPKDKPFLEHKNAVLSAPVRHIFMIGVVWFLKNQFNCKSIKLLEIGSWFGASTLSWAQGLKEYYNSEGEITCIDAWEPFFDLSQHSNEDYVKEMEELLSSDYAYNVFIHNMNTLPNGIITNHHRDKSTNILPKLDSDSFDIIFIDADHTYEPVKKDIKESLRLVKDGGIICGDDLNLQLHEIDSENAKKNKDKDFVKDPLSKKNFHPGVTLAVEEFFGEVSSWGGFWGMQKKGDNWVKFSLKDMQVVYPEHFTKDHIQKAKDHFDDIKGLIY